MVLRKHLEEHPLDATAMAILAETLMRFERYEQSAELLARAIELAPNLVGARHTYVTVLLLQNKPEKALPRSIPSSILSRKIRTIAL